MLEKSILEDSGLYHHLPLGVEDGDLWRRILAIIDCLYIKEPLVYYDGRLNDKKFYNRVKRKVRKLLHKAIGA
jgi:hypothetical protein